MTAALAGVAGVALATLLAFLPRLADTHVRPPDETRPALIAREMRASGAWSVPRLNGRPQAATPPLFPWTVALASGARVTERSLRLPSALAAAAATGVTGLIGIFLIGPPAGAVAAAVFASSAAVFDGARTGHPAMLLTLCAALALWSLARWCRGGRAIDAAALGIWVGLGALGQGVVGVVPLLVAAGAALALRRPPARAGGHLALALGTALAVVAVWLGAVMLLAPDAAEYLPRLGRRAARDLGRLRPRGWADLLEAFGGGFLPWSLVLPGAVVLLVWRWQNDRPPPRAGGDRSALWLPALWAAAVVALVGLGGFARGVSPLLAFPALALVTAWAWHSASPEGRWALATPVLALGFTVALAGAWMRWQQLPLPIGADPPIVVRPTLTVVTIAVCAAVAAGAAVLLLRASRPAATVLALAAGTLAILIVWETAARVEAVNRARPAPTIAERFARQLPRRARVAYLDRHLVPAIVFYLPREAIRLGGPGSVRRLAGHRGVHLLAVERDLTDVTGRLGVALRRQDAVEVGGTVYVLAAVEERAHP